VTIVVFKISSKLISTSTVSLVEYLIAPDKIDIADVVEGSGLTQGIAYLFEDGQRVSINVYSYRKEAQLSGSF